MEINTAGMEMWLEYSRKGRELLKCDNKILLGSWGDGAWQKCSLHRCEDLSSDPSTLLKARHVCDFRAERQKQADPKDSLDSLLRVLWPASLSETMSSRFSMCWEHSTKVVVPTDL